MSGPVELHADRPTADDLEYNPRLRIRDPDAYFARWRRVAAETRTALRCQLDLPYGPTGAETLDFFPAGPGAPLLVFVHGGYWRAFDKADFSWVAPPYVAAGVSVAVVNYALLPATPLSAIVGQVRRACAWLYLHAAELRVDATLMVCSGHSAGGHLTAMMFATDWPALDARLPARLLAGGVAISGLFDLVPLTRTTFLASDLGLDVQAVRTLSPITLACHNQAPLLPVVGALESDGFHQQAVCLATAWGPGIVQPLMDVAGCDHLSVCEAFTEPGSGLFATTCQLLTASLTVSPYIAASGTRYSGQ
jgi:arylformamidase